MAKPREPWNIRPAKKRASVTASIKAEVETKAKVSSGSSLFESLRVSSGSDRFSLFGVSLFGVSLFGVQSLRGQTDLEFQSLRGQSLRGQTDLAFSLFGVRPI